MERHKELQHLRLGAKFEDKVQGIGITKFNVQCSGNSQEVLYRSKEVLQIVFNQKDSDWPSNDKWRQILPKWFIDKCTKEKTEKEVQLWLQWWRKLPPQEKRKAEQELGWSLDNWTGWFYPSEREWFWWDAVCESENNLSIFVEINQWPFPWGELEWLLKVSGAHKIETD